MSACSGTHYDCYIERVPRRGFAQDNRHLPCHALAGFGCLRHPNANDETGESRFASDCSLFHSVLYLWRMAPRTSHCLALGVVRDGVDRDDLPTLDRTSADRHCVLASSLSTNFVRVSSMRFSSKRRVYLLCNRGCAAMANLSRCGQVSSTCATHDNSGCRGWLPIPRSATFARI
jgi:hypothetical protein